MAGKGFLAIWSDVEAGQVTDYLHWLAREHTTERVTTDGFLGVRVFRAVGCDAARFFILYDLAGPEVLAAPAYLARLDAPTPWSRRIMPTLTNFIRGGGRCRAFAGIGRGGVIAVAALRSMPDDPAGLAAQIAARDRIAAVRLLETDRAGTGIQTREKQMRRQDRSFAGLLVVEALDEAAANEALGGLPLAALPIDETVPLHAYRQIFALDRPGIETQPSGTR